MKERRKPVVAPGNEDYLEKDATRKDLKKGDFTRVTKLSYDEVEPSRE